MERPGYSLWLGKLLQSALSFDPETRVYPRRGPGVTYRELAARLSRLAEGLASLGVSGPGPGERMGTRVATLCWNTLCHYEAYLAVPMMGAVLHPVNVRLAPLEIAYILNHAGDRVVMVHPDFMDLLGRVLDKTRTVEAIVYAPEEPGEGGPDTLRGVRVVHYWDLVRTRGGLRFEEVPEDLVALMSYTSGTTGLPKGVYHSHRQVVLHAMALGLRLSAQLPPGYALTHYSTVLHTVPMFHAYSWGLPYLATLLAAGQVYPGRFNAEEYLRLIAERGVTHTAGVPTVLKMLLDSPAFERLRDRIRGLVFMCGGSALPRGLAERAEREGIRVVMSYGMTETAPVLTVSSIPRSMGEPSDPLDVLTQRAGLPLPLAEIMVADPDKLEPVPRDGRTMGEVVVRAPWVAQEYYRDPERTERAWRGGWFHTGDIAVWDERGYIQLQDRAKDVIKSGGEWISSLRLESLISTHPCVAEVAVVAAYHPKWQERPVAAVVPKPGCSISEEDVLGHLRRFVEEGVIPKWWLPDRVVFMSALPKTSVGKLDKKRLREMLYRVLVEEPGG